MLRVETYLIRMYSWCFDVRMTSLYELNVYLEIMKMAKGKEVKVYRRTSNPRTESHCFEMRRPHLLQVVIRLEQGNKSRYYHL
jgi:hypothetical protein